MVTVSNCAEQQPLVMQHTLASEVSCMGVGLHSGASVTLTLKPAAANSGIRFVRTDLEAGKNEILAEYQNVCDTLLCTKISNEHGASVGTIEHLMAAISALEIDNLLVEINGPEVPVMDGSSAPFVFLIESVGLKEQDAPRRYIEVLKDVSLELDGKAVRLSPAESFVIDFSIEFASEAIGKQRISFDVSASGFKHRYSKARTFGFLHEVEHLRSMGLARGGSLDNAVVVDGDRVLNETGLRYSDEFVRHKVLDAVGDLYLAGGRLLGRFTADKAGHQLNNMILHSLLEDQTAWRWAYKAAPAKQESNVIAFPSKRSRHAASYDVAAADVALATATPAE